MNRTWLLFCCFRVAEGAIGGLVAFVAWHWFIAINTTVAVKSDPAGYVVTNVVCQHDMDFVLTEPLDCSHGGKLR